MSDPTSPPGTRTDLAPDLGLPAGLRRRFRPLGVVGEGGFGRVIRARDLDLDREVAIKLLTDRRPRERSRFQREAGALAELQHPHLVRIYDHGEADGTPYLVMEFLGGPDLRSLTDPEAIRGALLGLAEGLDHLHRAGLVHRDVKPANVRLTPEGRAVLLDLGLVLATDPSKTRLTETRSLTGTLSYLPPESLRGEPASPAADWFALGVTGYELLEGHRPFDPDTLLATMSGADLPVPAFSRLSEGDPLRLALEALLRPDPARRGGGAAWLRGVLEPNLASLAGVPAPGSTADPASTGMLLRPESAALRRTDALSPDSGGLGAGSGARSRLRESGARPAGKPGGSWVRRLALVAVVLAVLALGVGRQGAGVPTGSQGPEPVPVPAAPAAAEIAAERKADLETALDALLAPHRGPDGGLADSLRGAGYGDHLDELAREYLDPLHLGRWRSFLLALGAWIEASLAAGESEPERTPILRERMVPALRHLAIDHGMLRSERSVTSLPPTLRRASRLDAYPLEALADRIDDLRAEVMDVLDGARRSWLPRMAPAWRLLLEGMLVGTFSRDGAGPLLAEIRRILEARSEPDRALDMELALVGLTLMSGPNDPDRVEGEDEVAILLLAEERTRTLPFVDARIADLDEEARLASFGIAQWYALSGVDEAAMARIEAAMDRMMGFLEVSLERLPPSVFVFLRWYEVQDQISTYLGGAGGKPLEVGPRATALARRLHERFPKNP